MLTGGMRGRRLLAGLALIAAAGIVSPPMAAASNGGFFEREARHASCPATKTLRSVEKKTCPANPRRGVIVLSAACCVNHKGHVNCKKFQKCPKRSPS